MPEFEIYECESCGEAFKAHPDANAVGDNYCSPSCEIAGKGL